VRLLRRDPELARAGLATAIVCGELAEVERLLRERPELANAKTSTKEWEPLLYLCFARLPGAGGNAVAIARALLDHGADPNVFFMAGDSRYTPLTGAVGEGEEDRPPHERRDELVRLLLERGARPYDQQVIYNLHFRGDVLWFLQLMYEFGARADWDDPAWPMLDMERYGNGARWHLRIAIDRNDLRLAEWCLAHGADPDAPPESDPRFPQVSLYEYAMLQGRTEIAALLARHGAPVSDVPSTPEDPLKALFAAVKEDRADLVERLLDRGLSPDVEDAQKRRPLHVAASHDALRTAELLIRRGAEIDPVETQWDNTPLDFAVYHEHPRLIELLGRHSRDVWNLTFTGSAARLREVLAAEPALARVTRQTTPLFWLPEEEGVAMEIVRLFLSHGADASFRAVDGTTAADAARKRGMHDIAAFLDGCAAYDRLAHDLVAAHDSGDAAALQRLARHYGRPLTHDDVRADVRRRVYALRQRGDGHLALSEARELLARDAGFGHWAAFLEARAAGRPAPPPYQVDRGENAIRPRRALAPDDWDALLGAMREQGIAALHANGQMTDAVLRRVAALGHVTRLDLSGSRGLTSDGLRHLAAMPQLTELDLGNYPGGDDGLAVLRHLPNLKKLGLSWAGGITDAGAAHLASCEQLESVDLMGTATGDGAIRALAAKPQLRRFKSGKLVTDDGLALLQHFPLFAAWQGGTPKYSLMDSEPEPNHLLLDGPFTDTGAAALAQLEGLFALTFFWHTPSLTPAALAPLAHLPHLGFLRCEGALCDDTAMRHLAALPHLRMLIAQGTVATDDGFAALARSRTLEYLWGRECPNLTGRGFAALAHLPALRGLGVSCSNVDDAALATLPRFPELRELMPMDVQDDGFRHVGSCARLETLWCMYCRTTTDAATEHIQRLPLRTYYAGKTLITDRSLELLSRMESLERLMFWGTAGVTDDGVRALKRLPRLRELSLEELPHVTAEVAAEFPAGIRVTYAP